MTGQSNEEIEQLVARFQNGDDPVFALLVERMTPMIRREMSLLCFNRADSDDLMQEALLGLLMAAKRFSAESGVAFAAFACICIRRRLWKAAKKLTTPELPQQSEVVLEELERLSDLSQSDPSEQLLLREENAAFLNRLKKQLSSMEYAVLTYHLSAYSYEEIAASCGISTKSVDNALQRVRKKLTKLL